MKCRVCDSELQEGAMICQNCGRMVVSFPEPLPEALQECLKKERAFYERQMASGGALQHELGESKAKIVELNAKVASLQKDLIKELNNLEEMGKAKKELESKYATLNDNFEKKNQECQTNGARVLALEKEKAMLFYKICSKCYTPYPDKGKFCLKCGAPRPEKPKG